MSVLFQFSAIAYKIQIAVVTYKMCGTAVNIAVFFNKIQATTFIVNDSFIGNLLNQ